MAAGRAREILAMSIQDALWRHRFFFYYWCKYPNRKELEHYREVPYSHGVCVFLVVCRHLFDNLFSGRNLACYAVSFLAEIKIFPSRSLEQRAFVCLLILLTREGSIQEWMNDTVQ